MAYIMIWTYFCSWLLRVALKMWYFNYKLCFWLQISLVHGHVLQKYSLVSRQKLPSLIYPHPWYYYPCSLFPKYFLLWIAIEMAFIYKWSSFGGYFIFKLNTGGICLEVTLFNLINEWLSKYGLCKQGGLYLEVVLNTSLTVLFAWRRFILSYLGYDLNIYQMLENIRIVYYIIILLLQEKKVGH